MASTTNACPPRASTRCSCAAGSQFVAGGMTCQVNCKAKIRTHSRLYATMSCHTSPWLSPIAQAARPTGNTNNSGVRSTNMISSASAAKTSRLNSINPALVCSSGKEFQLPSSAAATSAAPYHGQLHVNFAGAGLELDAQASTRGYPSKRPTSRPTMPILIPMPAT